MSSSSNFQQIYNGVLKKIKAFLIDEDVPSYMKNFPKRSIYLVVVARGVQVLIFMVVVVACLYISNVGSKYLSIGGAGVGSECEEVSKTISISLKLDYQGIWEGSTGFSYSRAVYQFDMNNFVGTKADFKNVIQIGYNILAFSTTNSPNYTLASNLLTWMTWGGFVDYKGSTQNMVLSGSPASVFRSDVYTTAFSNIFSDCQVQPSLSYDTLSGIYTIEYSYSAFMSDASCSTIINPEHMGYNKEYGNDRFKISLNMRTFATAVALNRKVGGRMSTEMIEGTFSLHRNGTVLLAAYYDPTFNDADPVWCAGNGGDRYMCAIRFGNVFAHPVLNHYGVSDRDSIPCNCSDSTGTSEQCNEFKFLSGMILHDYHSDPSESADSFISSYLSFRDYSDESYSDLAYYPSYAAIKKDYSNRNDSNWRINAYSFCMNLNPYLPYNSSVNNCPFLTMFTSNTNLHTVSDYYYQVPSGSCSNTFLISQSALDYALDSFPVPLIEVFSECHETSFFSMITALGVGMGMLDLAFPVMVAISVGLGIMVSSKKILQLFPESSSSIRSKDDDVVVGNFEMA